MYTSIYGYFSNSEQIEPEHDPTLDVDCPICHQKLFIPVKTISLILDGDNRSYFYRVHKNCYESSTDELKTMVDSLLIDAIASTKNVN